MLKLDLYMESFELLKSATKPSSKKLRKDVLIFLGPQAIITALKLYTQEKKMVKCRRSLSLVQAHFYLLYCIYAIIPILH